MGDTPNNAEILLRISSDVESIKKMQEKFSAFKKETQDAGKSVESLGEKLKNLSAGHVAALGGAFKVGMVSVEGMVGKIQEAIGGTTELAAEMKRVTLSTGMAGEAVQVFSKGGRIAMDDLITKLQLYRVKLGEALMDPKGSQATMFKSNLGLDPKTLSAAPMQDQMAMLAESLGKVTDANKRAALAQELFGRNSAIMLPMLERLRTEGYEGLKKTAEETAGVLGDDMAAAINKYKKAASDASNRLSVELAETNIRLLRMQAGVAGFLADHANAIQNLGIVIGQAAIGYTALSMIAKHSASMVEFSKAVSGLFANNFVAGLQAIPFLLKSSLPPMMGPLGLAMGGALGLAIAGVLISSISDAMVDGIEAGDRRIVAAGGKSLKLLRDAGKPTSAAAGAKTVAEAKADLKASQDAFDALEKKRGGRGTSKLVTSKTQGERLIATGWSEEDQKTLEAARSRLLANESIIKNASKVEASGKSADALNAHNKTVEAARETMAVVSKLDKESTVNAERQQILAEAADGNSATKLAALEKVLALTRADYAAKRELAEFATTEKEGAEYLAALKKKQEDEERPFLREKIAINEKLSDQEFSLMKDRAKDGDVAMQTAAIEAEIARITKEVADGKRDQIASQVLINGLRREEYALAQKVQVEDAQNKSDAAQRAQGMKIQGIQSNLFLTDKQRKAQLYAAYKSERDSLPDQISTAEASRSQSEGVNPGMTSFYAGEKKRLQDREVGVQGDMDANRPLSMMDEIGVKMVEMQNGFQTIASTIGSVMQSAIDGISSSITGLLKGTMTWGEALRNIGSSVLNGVIGGFSKMFAEWIVGRLAMSATAKAASISEGVTDTAAKTPGALLSSISSFGVAAAIGVAALIAAMAMFDTGGYTTPGSVKQPAGIVHAGEWVAPQWMVNSPKYAPHIAALDAARNGRNQSDGLYSFGGFVKKFTGWDTPGQFFGSGMLPKFAVPSQAREFQRKWNLLDGTQITGASAGGSYVMQDGKWVSSADSLRVSGGSRGSSLSGSAASDSNALGATGAVEGTGSGTNLAFFNTRQDAETWLASQEGRRVMVDFIRGQKYDL